MELTTEQKEAISKFIEVYQRPVQYQVLGLFETLRFQRKLMQKEIWDGYIKVFCEQLQRDIKLLQEENNEENV